MKENVGKLDSYLRITCGLTMLGIGIAKESTILTAVGAMKVAEGVTKFCPILYLLNKSTKNDYEIINISKKITKNFMTDESEVE